MYHCKRSRRESGIGARTVGLVLAIMLLAGLTGCGTVVNVTWGAPTYGREPGKTKIYGGVLVDAHAISYPLSGYEPWYYTPMFLLGVIDMPLSIVMDTLTLPYTLAVDASGDDKKP